MLPTVVMMLLWALFTGRTCLSSGLLVLSAFLTNMMRFVLGQCSIVILCGQSVVVSVVVTCLSVLSVFYSVLWLLVISSSVVLECLIGTCVVWCVLGAVLVTSWLHTVCRLVVGLKGVQCRHGIG